jgi:hypothetical protein
MSVNKVAETIAEKRLEKVLALANTLEQYHVTSKDVKLVMEDEPVLVKMLGPAYTSSWWKLLAKIAGVKYPSIKTRHLVFIELSSREKARRLRRSKKD